MILYSTQDYSVFELLERGETYRAKCPYPDKDMDMVDERFLHSYHWISDQMDKKIGIRPTLETYPTWAFYQWYGPKKMKPDLRYTGTRCFAENRTCALMTLEIPDNQVLLSDYDAWHFVLNSWYLGDEKRADELWDIKRDLKGCYNYEYYPEWLRNELEESWHNVFDMELSRKYLEFEEDQQIIQATFWEIKPGYLKEAVKFNKTGKTTKVL
jgi:hypothetical protein